MEKFYLKQNVYDAARERIGYLYDEFEEVIVGFSGGKDSTVCVNLAIEVAKQKNRLPVKVLFIDQEAEWETVIDYVREVAARPEVEFYWFQIPLKIFNAASNQEQWFKCWEEGKNWIRDKEPNSIKTNTYDTDEALSKILTAIIDKDYQGKACYIAGVRTEESPTRMMALTENLTYKHITWGNANNKKREHYTFYPIYDWSYTDVWKAIHEHKWNYCRLYDYMYQYGITPKNMRVSSMVHEGGMKDLFRLQELEPETWDKMVARVRGVSTTTYLTQSSLMVKELPYMFNDWREYRDYLLDNLITDAKGKETLRKLFEVWDETFTFKSPIDDAACGVAITGILKNDFRMVGLGNFWRAPHINNYRKYKSGKIKTIRVKNPYLEAEYGQEIYAAH